MRYRPATSRSRRSGGPRHGVLGTLLGILLLPAGTAAVLVAGPVSSAPAPGGPGTDPAAGTVAVVHPGDTLWSVAARHAPSRDPYGVIEDIRRLNDLDDHTIHPGQELRIPED